MRQVPLWLVFLFAFIVAACSIIYELMFSQLLTIIFGGTVKRYSITIGLFLFSLGVGSILFGYVKADERRLFVMIELLITFIGFMGLLGIIKGAAGYFGGRGPLADQTGLLLISYVPIILVGIISGMEIPLLAKLGAKTEEQNLFGEVLGFDYFGSLVGTVLFAMVLYPVFGIVVCAFIVSFLNLAVATIFAFRYNKDRLLKALTLIALVAYVITIPQISMIQDDMIKEFRGERVFTTVSGDGKQLMTYKVTDFLSTRYQDILVSEVQKNPEYVYDGVSNYTCLHLDNDPQFCTPAIEGYHGGMVDVPLTFFEDGEEIDVLLIGGGDWVGVHYLDKFENVKSIELVDIDKEFTEFAKVHPFITQYNQGAWNSKKLSVKYTDGFHHVMTTDKTYDLIILDLPGLTHDKLAHLYSIEFFSHVHRIMDPKGMVVTWRYLEEQTPEHVKVLKETLAQAGFRYLADYFGYTQQSIADEFIVLVDQQRESHYKETVYLNRTWPYYQKEGLVFEPLVAKGTKVHSVFWPYPKIMAVGA